MAEHYEPSDADFAGLFDEADQEPQGQEPQAVEASPAPVAQDSTPEGTPEPADRGDGRDGRGRFVAKAADADSTAGVGAPDPAKAVETGAQNEGKPPTGDAPPVVPEPEVSGEPLTWKSGNQHWEFPGAIVTAQGIFIQPDRVELLKTALGKATTLDETRDALRRERLDLKQRLEVAEAQSKPALDEIERFMGMVKALGAAPDAAAQEQALSAILNWGFGLAQQEPVIRERMALEAEKRKMALEREAAQPDPDTERAMVTEALIDQARQQVAIAKSMPEFAHLTDAQYDGLLRQVADDPAMFLARDPNGQSAFHGDRFAALVRRESARQSELTTLRLEQQKALDAAKKAAQENALRLNGHKPVTPPVAAKPIQKSAPTQSARKQTRDEFEAELARDLEAALAE